MLAKSDLEGPLVALLLLLAMVAAADAVDGLGLNMLSKT
jgi:hypothetical protein